MILWINGAFGAGKTTTAGLVAELVDDAKVFDPEYVGYMLVPFVECPTGDFQDLALWRRLAVQTMVELVREYPGVWIAPMSLLNTAYRVEILGGIRAAGVDLREVVLTVPEAQLCARIDADEADPRARQWRHDHLSEAVAALDALSDAHRVDASQPPDQVAAAVAAYAD